MPEERKRTEREGKGSMTVAEAGQKGGERTAETHGHEFYSDIGHKGGQRVKELIEEGKQAEGTETGAKRRTSESNR